MKQDKKKALVSKTRKYDMTKRNEQMAERKRLNALKEEAEKNENLKRLREKELSNEGLIIESDKDLSKTVSLDKDEEMYNNYYKNSKNKSLDEIFTELKTVSADERNFEDDYSFDIEYDEDIEYAEDTPEFDYIYLEEVSNKIDDLAKNAAKQNVPNAELIKANNELSDFLENLIIENRKFKEELDKKEKELKEKEKDLERFHNRLRSRATASSISVSAYWSDFISDQVGRIAETTREPLSRSQVKKLWWVLRQFAMEIAGVPVIGKRMKEELPLMEAAVKDVTDIFLKYGVKDFSPRVSKEFSPRVSKEKNLE